MKKVLAAFLVLALAAPTFAVVEISGADVGGGTEQLLITFTTSGTPTPAVRGIALKLTISGGDILGTGDYLNPPGSSFNTFVDYAFTTGAGYNIGDGHPLAKATEAGVLATFPATVFVVSVGYLDQGATQLGLTGGTVAKLQLNIPNGTNATVTIEADPVRGGAAVGDDLGTVTIMTPSVIVAGQPSETVSTPTVPTVLGDLFFGGDTPVIQTLPVTTGGSTCSEHPANPVQYRFDWGDGSTSAWGANKQSKGYASVGSIYTIKAQARCSVNNAIESAWSAGFTHTVRNECQKYNLTRRINGATDNAVNTSDLNVLIAYVNANRSNSAAFSTLAAHPNYDARYNFDSGSSISTGDLNVIIGYVNAARTNSLAFSRGCPAL